MIYKEILSERQHLDKNIKALEQELSALPTGNIYCVHDQDRLKWFFNDGHGAKYIKKNQQELIKKLSNRKYLSLLLRDYIQEREAIDAYLSLHNVDMENDAQNLLEQPDYQQFLSPTFKTISQELQDWMQESYENLSSAF